MLRSNVQCFIIMCKLSNMRFCVCSWPPTWRSASTWRSCCKNSLNTQYIKLKVMRVLTFAENTCSTNLYDVCLINDV